MNSTNRRFLTFFLANESDTICLGNDIAQALKPKYCLTLSGDLGTGKSFLARSIIRALTENDTLEVLSPTFTLVQTYEAKIPIAHFDLYRLSNPQEFCELGINEILDEGICIIEWPEIGAQLLPIDRICIHIEYENKGRIAIITAEDPIIRRIVRSLRYI